MPARQELIRAAWEAAYGHIFSGEEIESVFALQVVLQADWSDRRSERVGGLVAETQGALVGTAGLSLHHDGGGEVTTLYVHPSVQRQGIGRRLWQECVRQARRRACGTLQVWALDAGPAGAFYEHMGCQPVERGMMRLGPHHEPCCGYRLEL